MGKTYAQVSDREVDLMRKWRKEGRSLTDIQGLTGRSRQTIIDHTSAKKKPGPGSGRRAILTEKDFKKLHTTLLKLQKKANANIEITVQAVKEAAGVEASNRTVLDLFHAHDVWFHPLRQKLVLTDEDVIKRAGFCDKFMTRSEEQWVTQPNAIIDNKHFPLYMDGAGRNEGARRTLRGGYRARGARPQPYLVKRKKAQKFSAPGVQVTAAVVKGKIRMFDFVKGHWSGQKAAAMYKGPLLRTLKRAFPAKAVRKNATWTVLEDNDPAGYKSSAGKAAKLEASIMSVDLPPRSPDLNTLDYSLWAAINAAMRKQERAFRKNKKETKEQYMARLRRTALNLPTSLVTKAVKDMHRRLRKISAAGGGLIVE